MPDQQKRPLTADTNAESRPPAKRKYSCIQSPKNPPTVFDTKTAQLDNHRREVHQPSATVTTSSGRIFLLHLAIANELIDELTIERTVGDTGGVFVCPCGSQLQGPTQLSVHC